MQSEKREILALILARGGSKSIPRKNLLMIAGKPLIAYTIEQALTSRSITRVIVSTDDEEIAGVARKYGAETPFMRPAEYAEDLSPDIDAFRHALNWLCEHEQYQPELVVHLRPTGPVRRVDLIDQAIQTMLDTPDADALRSVALALQTPYKMWRISEAGRLEPLLLVEDLPESFSLPRQMLPSVYWQNGYVDILRPRAVLVHNSMVGKHILPFIVDEPMYELDYPDDVPRVEAALQRLQQSLPLETSPTQARKHPV
jgi:N-acylneuraminate cytidylyltransferase